MSIDLANNPWLSNKQESRVSKNFVGKILITMNFKLTKHRGKWADSGNSWQRIQSTDRIALFL